MTFLDFIERFPANEKRRNRDGDWHCRCPGHDDGAQSDKFSLHVTRGSNGIVLHCFAGCTPDEIARALRITLADLFFAPPAPPSNGAPTPREPLATLADFAARKRLDLQALRAEGWTEDHRGLVIPYLDRDGTVWRHRYRRSLEPGQGFSWDGQRGRGLIPYGRHRLDQVMEKGELWLVEGESDAVTAWAHGLGCLGVPGNLAAKALTADDLAGIETLWLVMEPGQSGIGFAASVREQLQAINWCGTARLVHLPMKDLSDLHVANPEAFDPRLAAAQQEAEDLVAWVDPRAAASALSITTTPVSARPFTEGAGELLARPFPPVESYIESILTAEGSGFIGGEEKLGKSYYALTEAFCLAMGLTVCGRFAVPQRRRVLFIEEEDSPRRTQLRLRALARGRGLDPDDPAFQQELSTWFRLAVWTGFRLDEPSWLARLEDELTAFPAAVVYLDVLRKLTAKDLNKQAEASGIFDELDRIRRTRECLFRVLHHYRKSQGLRMGRGSQEMGGSYVLAAWAEQSVFLEPIGRKGGGTRFDVQLKDGAAPQTLRLRWESEGPQHEPLWVRLHLDDMKADQAPGEKYADQVLQLLATLPPEPSLYGQGVTVKVLAVALKISDRTVRRTLDFLIEKGLCAANASPSTKLRRYFCTAPSDQSPAAQPETQDDLPF
jgi:hypothetical protein